VIMNYIISLWI